MRCGRQTLLQGRSRPAGGRAHLQHGAFAGQVGFVNKACSAQVFVAQDVLYAVHGRIGNVGLCQQLAPLGSGARAHDATHLRVHLVNVGCAVGVGGKTRVLHALRFTKRLKKVTPMFVVVNEHAQIAILGGIGFAVGGKQAGITGRPNRWLVGFASHVVAHYKLSDGLKHGHHHRLPKPGLAASIQRGGHGVHGVQTCDAVA